MSSKRLLKDTVLLKNYIGEINDVATYQETIFECCYCSCVFGAGIGNHGKNAADSGRLYIFDYKSKAKSINGKVRTFLPYREWLKAKNKDEFWTLSDIGRDFFVKDYTEYRIVGFSHKTTGSKRMWHFEVDGE